MQMMQMGMGGLEGRKRQGYNPTGSPFGINAGMSSSSYGTLNTIDAVYGMVRSGVDTMFGYQMPDLRNIINPPIGITKEQQLLLPRMREQDSSIGSAITQSGVSKIFGSNLDPSMAGGLGLAMNLGSQMSPLVNAIISSTLGYDPAKLQQISRVHRTSFLDRQEFLGEGGMAPFMRRMDRLTKLTTASALQFTEEDLFREEDGKVIKGLEGVQMTYGGRKDRAFRFLSGLQAAGVSGIFDRTTGRTDMRGKGGDWLKAGASIAQVIGTDDPNQALQYLHDMASTGDVSQLDDKAVLESTERIRKMAQFLGVSTKAMHKASSEIQDMIKQQTGSQISISNISSLMAQTIGQGRMAGLTDQQSMELVNYQARNLAVAKDSHASNKLMQMAAHGDEWALDILNNNKTVKAEDIHRRYRGSGLTGYNDKQYMKRLRSMNEDLSSKTDTVTQQGMLDEQKDNLVDSIVNNTYKDLRRRSGGSPGALTDLDRKTTDAMMDSIGNVIKDDKVAAEIRSDMERMRAEGASEAAIQGVIYRDSTLSEDQKRRITIEGRRKVIEEQGTEDLETAAMRYFSSKHQGMTGVSRAEADRIISGKGTAEEKWNRLRGSMTEGRFESAKRESTRSAEGKIKVQQDSLDYLEAVDKFGGVEKLHGAIIGAKELDKLKEEYEKDPLGRTEEDWRYEINKSLKSLGMTDEDIEATKDMKLKDVIQYGTEKVGGNLAYLKGMEDKGVIKRLLPREGLGREESAILNPDVVTPGADAIDEPIPVDTRSKDEVIGDFVKAIGEASGSVEKFTNSMKDFLMKVAKDPSKIFEEGSQAVEDHIVKPSKAKDEQRQLSKAERERQRRLGNAAKNRGDTEKEKPEDNKVAQANVEGSSSEKTIVVQLKLDLKDSALTTATLIPDKVVIS